MDALKRIVLSVLLISVVLVAALWAHQHTDLFRKLRIYNPLTEAGITIDFESDLTLLTERYIREQYSNQSISCNYEPGDLGERVCWIYVSSVNELPSEMVAFFFTGDALTFIRVAYPRQAHQQVSDWLSQYPKFPSCRNKPSSTPIAIGVTNSGLLAIAERIEPNKDAIFTWKAYKDERQKQAAWALALLDSFRALSGNDSVESCMALKDRS